MSELEIESADDPRMIGAYRPFSVLSLVALLAAFFSGLAVLNPTLVALPLTALGLALAACGDVGFSGGKKGGRWAALTAALLAGIFLLAGPCYTRWRQMHYFQVARDYADVWFGLIQDGEIYRPFHLMREFPDRQPTQVDLKKYYDSLTMMPNAKKETNFLIRQHTQLEPEKSIRQFGRQAQIEFQANHYYKTEPRAEYFTLRYRIRWPAESGRPDWPMLIMLKRTDHKLPIGPQWTVIDVYPLEAAFERTRSNIHVID